MQKHSFREESGGYRCVAVIIMVVWRPCNTEPNCDLASWSEGTMLPDNVR